MVLVWEFISGMSCLGILSGEYSLGVLVWEFLFGTSCLGIHVWELFSGSFCLGSLSVSSCLGFLVWSSCLGVHVWEFTSGSSVWAFMSGSSCPRGHVWEVLSGRCVRGFFSGSYSLGGNNFYMQNRCRVQMWRNVAIFQASRNDVLWTRMAVPATSAIQMLRQMLHRDDLNEHDTWIFYLLCNPSYSKCTSFIVAWHLSGSSFPKWFNK